MTSEQSSNNASIKRISEREKKIMQISSVGSAIGLIGGMIYAFKNNKSFWGYIGYGLLLFPIVGGTVANLGARAVIKK